MLLVARYAVAAAALVLVVGSVAIGSSWLESIRPTDSAGPRPTSGEGVLAGVPSAIATSTPSQKPSASPSERESPSADPSQAPTEVGAAPTFIIPAPTYQAPPPPPPTTGPTVAPERNAAASDRDADTHVAADADPDAAADAEPQRRRRTIARMGSTMTGTRSSMRSTRGAS